jgi:ferric-dicitrate binding protein FerR (iron transport regulator)
MKTETRTESKVSWLKLRWHGRSHTPKEKRRLRVAVACIIVFPALAVFYAMGAWNAVSAFMTARTVKQTPAYTNASVTVTAGAGSSTISADEPTVREFEDSTRVELARGSKLVVEYTPDKRLLRLLAGEVTVYVAKDPRRPLSVQADQLTAIAVGTKFKVVLSPTPRVHVIEGTVEVWDGPVGDGTVGTFEAGDSYPRPPLTKREAIRH